MLRSGLPDATSESDLELLLNDKYLSSPRTATGRGAVQTGVPRNLVFGDKLALHRGEAIDYEFYESDRKTISRGGP